MLTSKILSDTLEFFFNEDDIKKNFNYTFKLPRKKVECHLKFKDDMTISGLPFFFEALNFLSDEKINYSEFLKYEGKKVLKNENFIIKFSTSFDIALSAERIALNLLQRSCAITTHTKKFIEIANEATILDTRKTTPGLRILEKYATQIAGAKNHRFNQTDVWMIKDNHKNIFGGLKEALKFFKSVNTFYTPIVLEIHSIEELKEALDLDVRHFMLDNFSLSMINEAISLKKNGVTYEVSGGVTLENLNKYDLKGIDAISSGSLTYGAAPVDISLKYYGTNDA